MTHERVTSQSAVLMVVRRDDLNVEEIDHGITMQVVLRCVERRPHTRETAARHQRQIDDVDRAVAVHVGEGRVVNGE